GAGVSDPARRRRGRSVPDARSHRGTRASGRIRCAPGGTNVRRPPPPSSKTGSCALPVVDRQRERYRSVAGCHVFGRRHRSPVRRGGSGTFSGDQFAPGEGHVAQGHAGPAPLRGPSDGASGCGSLSTRARRGPSRRRGALGGSWSVVPGAQLRPRCTWLSATVLEGADVVLLHRTVLLGGVRTGRGGRRPAIHRGRCLRGLLCPPRRLWTCGVRLFSRALGPPLRRLLAGWCPVRILAGTPGGPRQHVHRAAQRLFERTG